MQNLDSTIKRMTIREFVDFGFLQEVNRQFFHPLGLALCLRVDSEDPEITETLCSIWDSRDDPEGFVFGGMPDQGKMCRVAELLGEKSRARQAGLGFIVQPVIVHQTDTEV